MSPAARTIHAWLLTLLLLSSTTMSSRACVGCDTPAQAGIATTDAGDSHGCCAADEQSSPSDQQDAPIHQDCDCPLGCCPTATVKAMSGPSGVIARTIPAEFGDIPASRPRAGPASEGPRRPPRA